MSEHRWSWTLSTSIPSREGAHLGCMQQVLDQLAALDWTGRDRFAVEMALEESLTNAFRHGNKFDMTKQVFVQCKVSPERFWLRVEDEGCGFVPGNVPDCTADKNLECPGGRGLKLIKAYMTRVEYNERGNCITMEKTRSSDCCG